MIHLRDQIAQKGRVVEARRVRAGAGHGHSNGEEWEVVDTETNLQDLVCLDPTPISGPADTVEYIPDSKSKTFVHS